jgi:hypothetical protein
VAKTAVGLPGRPAGYAVAGAGPGSRAHQVSRRSQLPHGSHRPTGPHDRYAACGAVPWRIRPATAQLTEQRADRIQLGGICSALGEAFRRPLSFFISDPSQATNVRSSQPPLSPPHSQPATCTRPGGGGRGSSQS